MKTVLFDASVNSISNIAEGMQKDDSLLLIVPLAGDITTAAPTKTGKYKDYFRIQTTLLIPKDCIKGEDALDDFGAFTVMRLPKDRVQDHMKRDEGTEV
ncbi:hypothetical protein J2Z32_003493 [Paenibacillus turicensis]|uniref:Uncharacterized protein n=1 Tax=Paenibacillus turicensis TaxID=160487 RepID=A0ABS4FW81_9BACL|nr:hypothetical protein [Paenibacillus turicensis]MBP1906829.1 hypothetical protein [Paenibacillus turicensis]